MGALVRKEFTVYFKNPTGWFTLCVYTLISGVCFVFAVINNNTTSMYTYFALYLYIANMIFVSLLSFKFFSEEKKNGTDKLWTTCPVSLYTVVLSKFVSAFCLFFIGSLVNVLYAVILGMFGDFDVSTFVVQYIGVLLVGAAMISVAVFISTFTEHQISTVAAVFGTLLFMYIIGAVSKYLPSWLAAVLKSISLYSRYGDFAMGILSLAPIVFYVSVTAVFLFLSVRMLEKRRWE